MDIFKHYRVVKEQIANLEKLKEELEMKIMDELDSDGVTNRATDYGQFAIMGRKTYIYSDGLLALFRELSKLKKIEELDGTATLNSDSRHVRLIIPKSETQIEGR